MKISISIISNSDNKIEPLDLSTGTEDSLKVQLDYLYEKNPNQGILNATGDYVIFLDQHDILLESGLRSMIKQAVINDSEIIVGAAYREDIGLFWNRDKLFREERLNTNLQETPYLIYDTTLSNKLFKRSFLIENNLTFMEGNKYNHQLFTVQSFSHSEKITVLPVPACRWSHRKKIKGKKTNRLAIADLEQRLTVLKEIDDLYSDKFDGDIKNEMFLRKDLLVYLNDILYGDQDHMEAVLSLIKEYIQSIDEDSFMRLKALDRLKYYLLKQDLVDELLQVLRFQKELYTPMTVAISDRVYGQYPFFLDEKYQIPKEVYDVTNEMQVVTELDTVKLTNGTLYMKGLAYINYLDFRGNDGIEKRLMIRNRNTNLENLFPLNNRRIDDRVINKGNGYYYYLFAGFENELQVKDLAAEETYDVYMSLSFNGITMEQYIFTIANGELVIDYNRQVNYDLYTSNVGSPALVNDIQVNEGDTLLFTGNGYIGFYDLDEEHYFIRNLLLFNKVTNETHRHGVHANILEEDKLLEMNNGLIFKTNIEFLSYIPLKYKSGIWDIKLSTREADGFEIIAPVKTELYAFADGRFQLNNSDFYLSSFNSTEKDLLLYYFNKDQKPELSIEQKLKNTNNQLDKTKRKLKYMEESFSWKITKPIRVIKKGFSKK